MRSSFLAIVLALGLGSACGSGRAPEAPSEGDAGRPTTAAASTTSAAASVAVVPPSVRTTRDRIEIPAGPFVVGSLPGTPGRRATREAMPTEITLEAFAIDRLPYPNDPRREPQRVATRSEAARLCTERGARLCTELEWERACVGDGGDEYPGGEAWDATRCTASPDACAASSGAQRMGTQEPEWTASDLEPELVRGGYAIIRRGARIEEPPYRHRCAARTSVRAEGDGAAAFRCCHGPAPSATYPEIRMHRQVRDLDVSAERLREILASMPETEAYAASFVPYGLEQGDAALTRGGRDRSALAGWELAPGPFAWSPAPGELVWVVAGRSGEDTLITTFYPLPDGRFVHAGSFVLVGEVSPIAVARTPPERGLLQWSACWGCPGEGGVIERDEEAVVRIIQR